ncbi:uncharacterized protein KD926_006992 [Aspergillus affinis]|uniref:uncharacterized protein n=1 Tax=Aspergillus affinis TaxID=1070780 RepID=UPI0022FE0E0F|nr:uncharacterized protein KD926_006992 [Aspergillus affinis]KAI9045691.1 hypothetical protein KD926_006992 [Aspergillus affinis]
MLQEYGLESIPEEECLFISANLLVLFYVDDIIIINRPTPEARAEAKRFKIALAARYELRHMGEVAWFLNIRVIRDRPNKKLWLCQDAYMEQMAAKFHLNDLTRWPETPLRTNIELLPNEEQATPGRIHEYQQKTGSALFPTIITRPDAALAVNELSRFSKNPSPSHIEAINRVIAYLYDTRYLALEFSASEHADEVYITASDASFANNEDRKSTGGYLCKLFGGPIEWKSGKQRAVTTSTTEAEYVALAEAAKATYWWRRVFKSLEFDPGHSFAIYCDNRQTIDLLTKDTAQRSKLRHVDINRSWLRQEVQEGRLQVKWIPTNQMTADGFTKALPVQKHREFVKMLNLVNIKDLIHD